MEPDRCMMRRSGFTLCFIHFFPMRNPLLLSLDEEDIYLQQAEVLFGTQPSLDPLCAENTPTILFLSERQICLRGKGTVTARAMGSCHQTGQSCKGFCDAEQFDRDLASHWRAWNEWQGLPYCCPTDDRLPSFEVVCDGELGQDR